MNKLTTCNDVISFIKESDYNYIISNIDIHPIYFKNKTLTSIKFIDYLLYLSDINFTCFDMINILDILIDRYDKSIIDKLTCISLDYLYKYFDIVYIDPLYSIIINKYFNKQIFIECNICYNSNLLCKLLPCEHICCIICSAELKRLNMKCHICSTNIISRVHFKKVKLIKN